MADVTSTNELVMNYEIVNRIGNRFSKCFFLQSFLSMKDGLEFNRFYLRRLLERNSGRLTDLNLYKTIVS